ncbi:potassium voltage-gated channel subfamily H member 8-like [Gigantopelta aegis]|uniref:potassium voltage-gated channel subfamily H member 8-like n=1 Tax=Gigantopelta aegis TaxID=1735272 RepID=UPI001B887653|nr:potassium voltage-gated channel subfamily H member 8-like [Gigantopelta aegis]
MPGRKSLMTSQNTFLDTIATRFDGIHSNFVLGNAQANGRPIVYCSDGFCELTGYGRPQVMSKSCACKFLYGEETENPEKEKIDKALEEKNELKTEIYLYKKCGSPFWCLLDIVPIKNEKNQVVLFLISHKDITRDKVLDSNKMDINENSDDKDCDDGDNHPSDMPGNYNYQRRHSRAVLYHLSGQFSKQNKAKSKLHRVGMQQLHSMSGKMPEYKVQEAKKSRYIIVHYGIFKIGWDWLILLCTFYIAIMVPFNAAFQRVNEARGSIYSDVFVEILFIVDIILNFRTSFVNKSGQIVYDSRTIAAKYSRGWFLLDLLAAIPFDLLYIFSIDTGTGLMHLLKVARLLRLARLLQKIDRFSQYSVLVLMLFMSMFALLAHWLACIWYAIGKEEVEKNPRNRSVGWLFELGKRIEQPIMNMTVDDLDMPTSYITALYFTLSSITSVGFGNVSANTNAEKIFSVCAMLVGAMMHAVVFGNVTAIIQRMYARRQTYHSKTKDLKDFFRTHHIPKPLKQRMQEFFQTMWSMNNGIDISEILKDFPEEMRGEIGLHLNQEILSLPIFENCTQGCLKAISLQTRRIFCAPGEFLLHKGDTVNYIYYLCNGSLEVLKEEMVVAILGKGDLFGTDVKNDQPVNISACDVRSLAYCEILCMSIRAILEDIALYPEFSAKFCEELPHNLTYNLREGADEWDCSSEETPVAPITTLPSISEDEELGEDGEKQASDEKANDADVNDHANKEHASSLPLLSKMSRVPNGDIQGLPRLRRSFCDTKLGKWFSPANENRSEFAREDVPVPPPPPRPLERPAVTTDLRRTSSVGSRVPRPIRTTKLRACRTSPTLSHASNQKSEETVLVHSLQVEVESTRASVDQLEHRMDSLVSEMKSISHNMEQILKVFSSLTNNSESPASPNISFGRPQFYFGHSPDFESVNNTTGSHQSIHSCASDPLSRAYFGTGATSAPPSGDSVSLHSHGSLRMNRNTYCGGDSFPARPTSPPRHRLSLTIPDTHLYKTDRFNECMPGIRSIPPSSTSGSLLLSDQKSPQSLPITPELNECSSQPLLSDHHHHHDDVVHLHEMEEGKNRDCCHDDDEEEEAAQFGDNVDSCHDVILEITEL